MKLSSKTLTGIMPVSTHTVIRHQKEDATFPKPERIGRTNYFEQSQFFEWLNSRATRNGSPVPPGTVRHEDKIISLSGVGALLDRSAAWCWSNVTNNAELTVLDLSPAGKSKNPRRYFIEREIQAAFSELIELKEVA
jgi:predicted DNA-binding transcriptional regulator AlpA